MIKTLAGLKLISEAKFFVKENVQQLSYLYLLHPHMREIRRAEELRQWLHVL